MEVEDQSISSNDAAMMHENFINGIIENSLLDHEDPPLPPVSDRTGSISSADGTSSATEDAVLSEVDDQCALCGSTYKQPRVLYCLHSFCEDCLLLTQTNGAGIGEQLNKHSSPDLFSFGELGVGGGCELEPPSGFAKEQEKPKPGVIKCPLCNQESNIGNDPRAVQMLLPDFVCINKQDSVAITRMEIVCNSCKSKEKAVARCTECATFLCPNCVQAHQFMRCFENHRVTSFDEMTKTGELYKIHKPVCCPAHPNEIMRFFCSTCQFPVCNECMVVTHKPPEHIHEKVSDESETRVRTELTNLVDAGKSKVSFCQDESQRCERMREELQSRVESAKETINETYQQYQIILERCHQAVLQDLEDKHNKIEEKINETCVAVGNTAERINDACRFASKLLRHGNAIELLAFKRLVNCQLLHLMHEMPSNRNIPVTLHFATDPVIFEDALKKVFGALTFNAPPPKRDFPSVSDASSNEAEQPDLSNIIKRFVPRMPEAVAVADHGVLNTNVAKLVEVMSGGMNVTSTSDYNGSIGYSSDRSQESVSRNSGDWMGMSAVTDIRASGYPDSAVASSGPSPFAGHPFLDPAANVKPDASRMRSYGLGANQFHSGTSSPTNSITGFSSAGGTVPVVPAQQRQPFGAQQDVAKGAFGAVPGYLSSGGSLVNMGIPPPPASSFSASKNGTGGMGIGPQYTFGAVDSGMGAVRTSSVAGFAPIQSNPYQTMSVNVNTQYPGAPSGGMMSHNSPPGLTRQGKQNPMQLKCRFGSQGIAYGQFNSPHGFCLGISEDIAIADTNNHRIQVFSKEGDFRFQFGLAGKEEGQLWYPRKVAVLRSTGNFVVCDRGMERSRIQIFTRMGQYVRRIDYQVSQRRYVEIVAGMAVTEQNEIVACDSVNPTVFALNESGDLLNWFDCSEAMREPSDIAVSGEEYFVCDFKGHIVAVFNMKGQFLRRFGGEHVTHFPNGIDISDAGDVLVGDSHGNRFHVAVFSKEGVLAGEFECQTMKVSRCCGLKITSDGSIVTLAKNNHQVLIMGTLYVN